MKLKKFWFIGGCALGVLPRSVTAKMSISQEGMDLTDFIIYPVNAIALKNLHLFI